MGSEVHGACFRRPQLWDYCDGIDELTMPEYMGGWFDAMGSSPQDYVCQYNDLAWDAKPAGFLGKHRPGNHGIALPGPGMQPRSESNRRPP